MNSAKIEVDPNKTVLVIGGRGFIGKQIVNHLEELGATVLIGSRSAQLQRHNGTRRVRLHKLQSQKQCLALLKDIDIVVNAVGILRQRFGETYEQVHHHAVAQLVTACAEKGIRFVHISVLGLANPSKSRFLNSKRRGELAIQKSMADWYICRPSLIDGNGGYGAKWFRRLANWPIHITPANASSMLAPLHVKDLGEAVAKIALSTHVPTTDEGRIFELGGEQRVQVLEYLRTLQRVHGARIKPNLKIPAWMARLASHAFDLLHITPFSFGHYELLQFDNVPKTMQIQQLLGRNCRPLGVQSDDSDFLPRPRQSIYRRFG